MYHNITSCDGSLVHNVANNITHITFTSVSRGSHYIVNVTAENIIGIGEESLINGKFSFFTIKIQFNNYIIIFYTVYIPISSSTYTSSEQYYVHH